MKKIVLLFAFFSIMAFPMTTFSYTSPGKPSGFVNDFARILSVPAENSLEQNLQKFSQETGHEISVITIQTLNGDVIEDYANTLFREWGIGKKNADNGVLFLIAKEDRKMRIEVGYGLEGALTDIESKHIQEDTVKPFFKDGKFEEGIIAGVKGIEDAIQSEVIPQAQKRSASPKNSRAMSELLFYGAFIFFSVVLPWLASMLGRTKSWWLGGIAGAVIGGIAWFFTGWLLWVFLSAVIGFVFDYFVSKNYKEHSDHPSWWAGGPWIGGGMGGGGFGGGFGGFGGGSSGGGGSSSNW
ncbi:TPM domain-containing protein [Candidatus Uhrbacteria bacterium]|nr:TPM domain-containing protein [Candidatus Uhrbacteria bacterium]